MNTKKRMDLLTIIHLLGDAKIIKQISSIELSREVQVVVHERSISFPSWSQKWYSSM
jgi:hypothetical protein